MYKAFVENPLKPTTPRETYSWFYWVYRLSYITAVVGYLVLMTEFFGLSALTGIPMVSLGSLLLFYGLYFGVLGRDLAEICAEKMANALGVNHTQNYFAPISHFSLYKNSSTQRKGSQ